jgi:hypothetical protein
MSLFKHKHDLIDSGLTYIENRVIKYSNGTQATRKTSGIVQMCKRCQQEVLVPMVFVVQNDNGTR